MSKKLENYYAAIEDLTKLFCKKYFNDCYQYDVNDWAAGDIGGVICINDYFFSMNDIEIAIKHKATKKELFDYYDFALERGLKNEKLLFSFENYLRYRIFRGFSFEKIEANLNNK